MRLNFIRHARNRMRQYDIASDEVLDCLPNPDTTEPTDEGRTNYMQDGKIRVTAIEQDGEMVIITVTPLDKARRRRLR